MTGMQPSSHKVLIELVNVNHVPLTSQAVEFVIPKPDTLVRSEIQKKKLLMPELILAAVLPALPVGSSAGTARPLELPR